MITDGSPKALLATYHEYQADILIAGGRNLYTALKARIPFLDINQEREFGYAGYDRHGRTGPPARAVDGKPGLGSGAQAGAVGANRAVPAPCWRPEEKAMAEIIHSQEGAGGQSAQGQPADRRFAGLPRPRPQPCR